MERIYRRTIQKKNLGKPDNHDGVVTHLESDILSVKSRGPEEALLQTKLVGVMESQMSYFKT